MKKTAILIGASGLIGSHVLKLLLNDDNFDKVKIFVRKKLAITNEKLEQFVTDFDDYDSFKQLVTGDIIFCCLGTTIKTAGSQPAFKKVDYEYPLAFAKAGKENGVKQYIIISSIGATINTSNFYLKTKGDIEQAIEQLNYSSFIILRPSMLLGKREEFRLGEKIGQVMMQLLSFMFIGSLKKYKAIHASVVAKAMVKCSLLFNEKKKVVLSDELSMLGK